VIVEKNMALMGESGSMLSLMA